MVNDDLTSLDFKTPTVDWDWFHFKCESYKEDALDRLDFRTPTFGCDWSNLQASYKEDASGEL